MLLFICFNSGERQSEVERRVECSLVRLAELVRGRLCCSLKDGQRDEQSEPGVVPVRVALRGPSLGSPLGRVSAGHTRGAAPGTILKLLRLTVCGRLSM